MERTVLCALILPVLAVIFPNVFGFETLRQLSTCSCEVGENEIVDLSPLAFSNKTPRFKDVNSDFRIKYSWNPCYDFVEGDCKGVAGCQITFFPVTHFYPLGSQSSAEFAWTKTGDLQLIYQVPGARKLFVKLMCIGPKQADKLEAVGERPDEQLLYDLTLYSQHACARSKSSASSISIGTAILISLSLTVLIYIAAGVSVQVFIRKASGLQAFPNASFWAKIPGLVKDGFIFTIRRGKVSAAYQPMS